MKNGKTEQFLDTGWYTEATLFYEGYIYWCEGCYDSVHEITSFFVDKWQATNEEDKYFHSLYNKDGTLNWTRVYEDSSSDLDLIKKRFLQAKIFDEKSFWEVESNLVWLEESTPIYI